ncbi:MAG: C-GCAxxG-C-C family protein [Oscillospiraceae bacterium]
MTHLEHTAALRADTETYYNCTQSVLIPFAKEAGLTEEQAYALGSNFGSGMRRGATCGAVTGALMVLGLLGYGEAESRALMRSFQEQEGDLNCAQLLAIRKEKGIDKKTHCDNMVFAAVTLVEQLIQK